MNRPDLTGPTMAEAIRIVAIIVVSHYAVPDRPEARTKASA